MLIRTNRYEVQKSASLLDFLLSSCLFFHSPEDVSLVCAQKRLLLNEVVLDTLDVELVVGDVVELLTPQSYEPSINADIELLFEDEYFFAVNKPAQLPVHPTGKYYFNTLSSLVERKFGLCGLYPYNRLDRETSGIVIFVKKPQDVILFQNTQIDKQYYALVFGVLNGSGIVDKPLLKKTLGELRHHMVVDSKGKSARTAYSLISSNDRYSLIDVSLLTGRKHQIRVHMASLGHPIVGDKQHGFSSDFFISYIVNPSSFSLEEIEKKVGASRQLLHCHKVSFIHPKTTDLISIQANLGKYFLDFLNKEKIDFV